MFQKLNILTVCPEILKALKIRFSKTTDKGISWGGGMQFIFVKQKATGDQTIANSAGLDPWWKLFISLKCKSAGEHLSR